jgi:hypothetical protein
MRKMLFTIIAAAAMSSSVLAQCADWLREGIEMQYTGGVYATQEWLPPGAAQSVLVLGGSFQRAGGPAGIASTSLATWDGTSYGTLGSFTGGNPGYNSVQAIEIYNGQLHVAGNFLNAGGVPVTHIARWTGTAWQPVGGPLVQNSNGIPIIRDLQVFNGELIACGWFDSIGGVAAQGIARWNGVTWQPMTLGGAGSDYFYCLGIYNGSLIVGGGFYDIGGVPARLMARWTGSGWAALGSGVPAMSGQTIFVWDMTVFQNELYVTGLFSAENGQSCGNVAAWNGSTWRYPGCGVWAADYFDRDGRKLHVYNGELYVAGYFETAGGNTPASCVARWNGSTWSAVGAGLNGPVPEGWGSSGVATLATFRGSLYAGGFIFNSGETRIDGFARWSGVTWEPVAGGVVNNPSGAVHALGVWSGRVVGGGDFYVYDPVRYGVYSLYSFDGLGMTGDLGGVSSFIGAPNRTVRAIASFAVGGVGPPSNDLYVGGDFLQMGANSGGTGAFGGIEANRIARRNDFFPPGWQPVGAGFNDSVRAITRFNGSVHAAGSFTASGATSVNRVARWTGSAWVPLTTFPTPSLDNCNGPIHAMKAYSSGPFNLRLVLGGEFTTAGGLNNVNRVIQYNANSQTAFSGWGALGAGFNTTVRALEFYSGSLYAAGDFTASGATGLAHIARWNGSAWVDVGGGVTGPVYAMTVSNSTLIVGGSFGVAGATPASNLARWNGTSWSAIGGGVNGTVRALAAYQGEIHVGGEFVTVKNGAIESAQWARFTETGDPWFPRGITTSSECIGQTAMLSARTAPGYGELVFQWYRNGALLSDGPTGSGSTISGSSTSTMSIANLSTADSGDYQALTGNDCGNASTGLFTLSVCVGDLSCDGVVNDSDFVPFVAAYNLLDCADPAMPSGCPSDLNNDGIVDDADFVLFVAAYNELICP